MPAVRAHSRVLVVDDEAIVLTLVSTILRRAGFDVETAGSGSAAWELMERDAEGVDLLLTDIVMPGLSGPALAEKCKARRPGLPVVFMTGFRNLPDIPGPIVTKPFAAAMLVDSVRQALGSSQGT